MSDLIEKLLIHIQENFMAYITTYSKEILNFDDEYIEEYSCEMETDCWGTARMLINVFNQGETTLHAYLYHIENPFFAGYHDFVILTDDYNGPWYLCDAWGGRYPIRILSVEKEQLDAFLVRMKNVELEERRDLFGKLFGDIEIDKEVRSDDIRIASINFNLKYSPDTVINYVGLQQKNKINIGNFDVL